MAEKADKGARLRKFISIDKTFLQILCCFMDWNTIKTALGFLGTMARKYTSFDLSGDDTTSIYNHLQITEGLHTSGQPTAKQFVAIKSAGFLRVINLAPAGAENALPDEATTLSELEMDYIHIPVDFQNPTLKDFEQFCAAMEAAGEEPIWAHCAANMRVSAFVYKYRRDVLGDDESDARKDMNVIWEPFGVWKEFTKDTRDRLS